MWIREANFIASNMFWLSLDAAPSAPSATLTPASSRSASGSNPDPHRRLEIGLCTIVTPASLTAAYSAASIHTQWARLVEGTIRPRSRRNSTDERPYR